MLGGFGIGVVVFKVPVGEGREELWRYFFVGAEEALEGDCLAD